MSYIRLFSQIISFMSIPVVPQIGWDDQAFVNGRQLRLVVGGVSTLVPSWSRGNDPRSGLVDLVSGVS